MANSFTNKFKRLFQFKSKKLSDRFPQHQFGKGTYSQKLHIHSWGEGAYLKIGAFCSIGKDVQIFLCGEHRVDWVTTYPFNVLWESGKHLTGHPSSKGDIVIGNDVWIGREAVILSGITIGDGAVIGARAVVSKDVPSYSIVAGNPARIIRTRFEDDIVQKLLRIKWWEWEDEKIALFLPKLLNNDISGFIEAAESAKDSTIPSRLRHL
jgi:acetyltransferase-like isoleucine patch superfamily enzyme